MWLSSMFEPPQIVADLPCRLLAEELRDRGSHTPRGRVVLEIDVDFGASISRGVAESHRSSILDVAAFEDGEKTG